MNLNATDFKIQDIWYLLQYFEGNIDIIVNMHYMNHLWCNSLNVIWISTPYSHVLITCYDYLFNFLTKS